MVLNIFYLHYIFSRIKRINFSRNYYERDYIKSISSKLPIGYRLLVKEHWGMLGERELSFYKEMKELGI